MIGAVRRTRFMSCGPVALPARCWPAAWANANAIDGYDREGSGQLAPARGEIWRAEVLARGEDPPGHGARTVEALHHEDRDVLVRDNHDAANTRSILTACAAKRSASWTSSRVSRG